MSSWTTPTLTNSGTLFNNANGTITVALPNTSSLSVNTAALTANTPEIGESQYFYVKASSAITLGQLVMFTGTVGASGVITAAPSTGITDGSLIIGVAAESIPTNGFGMIQNFGILKGFDTTGSSAGETWTDGTFLYYNPNVTGGFTKNEPSSPTPKTLIAAVINAGSGGSGSIVIRITDYPSISDIQEVQLANTANGQVLVYSAYSNTWQNQNSNILSANSATYLGNTAGTLANVSSWVTGNSATAYTNAVNYVANGVANGSIVVANATYAANAGLLGGVSLTTLQNQITGNAATSYSNAVVNAAYVAGVAYANAVAFAANASNITTGTLPYAQLPANVVIWSNNNIFSGIETFNANVSLASGNGTNQLLINTINATSSGLLANSTVLTLGNSSVNVVVNATSFSGTSNNSLNLGGATLSTIQTQITGNSATAYSNATSYTDGRISTANSAITGNSSTAYTNAVNYVANSVTNGTIVAANAVYAQNAGTLSSVTLATLQSQITGNSATAYTNAVSNAAALYQTTAGLAANVATLAANSATYLGNSSGTIANIASWVTGNSATAYANAVAFAANASTINSGSIGVSYLPANIVFWSNTNTFTANQTFSANVTTANIYSSGTVNAASYTIGTSFVANTTQLTITTPVSVNGSTGTAGYVLTTNGATGSPYWAVASAGVNTAAQYTFTNTISFNSQVNLGVNNTKLTFTANGSAAGNLSYFILQNDNNFVLYNTATDGSSRPIFATYTNSNTSPLNVIVPLKVSSAIQDGAGSNGVSGYVLTSNGTATNWAPTIQPRIVTTSSGATWTVNTDITDIGVYTGSGNGSGALTIAFTGTPSNGQKVTLKIHGTSAFTLTYGGSAGWSFSSDLYQPSSTSPYTDYQGFIYDSSLSKWCLLSLNRGFL